MAFSTRYLGHGFGLRAQHYGRLMEEAPGADFLEVISENFFVKGGRPLAVLEKLRQDVPLVLHGVSLSIGGSDPLSRAYLLQLKTLCEQVQPAWVSDHLCWGTYEGRYVHDLLPLPYTNEAIQNVVDRVHRVQDFLKRQILLENVSSYIGFQGSEMTEWEFLSEISVRADCGILLDVNNIFVSARNHGFDPMDYILNVPADRVGQIHLAGHQDKGSYLFDTHDRAVSEAVWNLYARTLQRTGRISTLVEWDEGVPELEVLQSEAARAQQEEHRALMAGKEAP